MSGWPRLTALYIRFVGVQGSERRGLAGAVGNTGVYYALNFVLMFALSVLLARALGAAELGLYAVALALLHILTVPARLGLTALVVRETAQALARSDWALIRGLWVWVGALGLLASMLVCMGLLVVIHAFPTLLDDERRAVLLAGVALVPLLGFGGLITGALRGLHKVPQAVAPELAVRPAVLFGLIGGAVLLGGALSAERAMVLNVLASGIFFAMATASLLRHAPPPVLRRGPLHRRGGPWLRAAIPLALIAGLLQINENTAILALGGLASDDQAGLFRVITQIALLGSFLLAPIHLVIGPQFARLHAEGDKARLGRLVTQTARVDAVLAAAYGLGMLLLGHWFLGVVFGPAFAVGHDALMILLAGQFLAALCGPVTELMNMTGQERSTLLCIGLGCALNLGLCLLLVPEHGGIGAAVAVAVSLVANRALLCLLARRRLGIDSTPLGRQP